MIKAVIFDMFETLVSLFFSERYQGREISADVGIPEKKFREIWNPSETGRTCGTETFEEVMEKILRENNLYSEEEMKRVIKKRWDTTAEAFNAMHPEIIPMMKGLKENGKKIALITNCFYEERDAIIKSELYPYFDALCMSCEMGLKKPDKRIFEACLKKLSVRPEECLYVGDGGSHELETAGELGMETCQAAWYLDDKFTQPVGRKDGFIQAESPLEIISLANGLIYSQNH